MARSKRMQRTITAVRAKYNMLGNDEAIEYLIRLVLKAWQQTKLHQNPELDDDARDIQNWSTFLVPLSSKDLQTIIDMPAGAVQRSIRNNHYPFSGLTACARGFFKKLPVRLIKKVAQCQKAFLEASDF